MFRGISQINLDEKGRFAMPTKYRDMLRSLADNMLVATIDTDSKCLLLYPLFEWKQIEQKISVLPTFNPVARRIQRLLVGHAQEINLDASGRVLLPQYLREYADLDKQMVLVGQAHKFEIWSEANWLEQRESWLSGGTDIANMPEELQELSI